MKTSFWSPFISDSAVRAICWTLIQSLWIGLLIALLCGIIIATTRKSAAALRYRLLCCLLVLFVTSMVVTFTIEVHINGAPTVLPTPPVFVITVASPSAAQQATVVLNRGLIDRTREFLNQNINIIFIAWLLLFLLKSLKMVSGLLYIQRIRNYKIHAVTEELKHKIEYLSSQIGIRRVVRLMQSELVKVPVAVGWLKPMILLPLGIALQLTPEQLEGILWHELAHIRRRDYLVNILQGLVETVFFFNPGLLWLSSLIRAEREACCDDMVLSRMSHKGNYLEALLAFGYGEFNQTGFAMGLGSGNQLRERLKRMINRENKRLSVVEKIVLVSGIITLSTFAGLTKANKKVSRYLISTAIEKAVHDKNKMTRVVSPVPMPANLGMVVPQADTRRKGADTSVHFVNIEYEPAQHDPNTHYVIAEDAAGTKYNFTITKDKLAALIINGVNVRDGDLQKYTPLMKHIQPPPPPQQPASPVPPPGVSSEKVDTLNLAHIHTYSWWGGRDSGMVADSKADDIHGNKYQLRTSNNKLISLSINGKQINVGGLPKYQYIANQAHRPLKPQQPAPRPVTSGDKADTISLVRASVASFRNAHDGFSTDKVEAEDNHGKNYYFIITNDKVTLMDIDGEKIKDNDLPKYQYMVRLVREKERAATGTRNIKMSNDGALPIGDLPQNRLQLPKEPTPPTPPPSFDKMIADVTNDLINEHVIKDKSDLLTIKLTYSELIVNGVKQPDDIQKKFAAKYYPGNSKLAKNQNYGLWYNARTHGVALGDFNLDLDAL